MSSTINQVQVINNLNRYLDWNNLPVRMDKEGVCNGLATVYAKYALQGKQKEFKRILTKIAAMSADSASDEEVNEFAKDVALSFMPSDYDKKLTQLDSIQTQEIDGKKLKAAYKFGVTTSDDNWAEILRKVGLKTDEAMVVRSANHAVSISKINKGYVIYDPNYPSGFKAFKNEKEVINELHYNVFRYTGSLGRFTDPLDISLVALPLGLYGPLGMQIEVVRHPDRANTPRTFPNTGELYKKYLNPDEVAVGFSGQINMDNLQWAVLMNNQEALDSLYAKGFKDNDPVATATAAVYYNATEVLPTVLTKIRSKNDIAKISHVIIKALNFGREKALEILLENNNFKNCFDNIVLQNSNANFYLGNAALGGNTAVLEKMIRAYQTNGKPAPLSDQAITDALLKPKGFGGNIIFSAITSKSIECVKLLYDQLKGVDPKIREELLLTNLLQAVKTNLPHMVDFFVGEISKLPKQNQDHIFKSIALSTTLVEQTDLSILRNLRANGVQFSETAKAVIDLKENRPIGFLLPLGIMLSKFTDYVSEILLERNEINENIKNFKSLKSQFSSLKDASTTVENTEQEDLNFTNNKL